MKRFLPIIFALLASALPAMATHNRAGEITYRQISKNPPTFEFTILTYTKSSSQADRKELELNYGDGKVDTVPRIKIVPLPDDMQRNEYVARHTFNGGGVYIISVTDPNRNASIVNIPNSIDVVFYIETMMTISPFLGYNNSPVLLNPPVDNAALNQIFIHNPNAWDVDGDSLAYHLITCKQEGGLNIPGYTLPSQHPPGPANQVSLDEITGDFVWDSPKLKGEYNVAILIEEWRKGVRIGYVLRDMQIDVYDQNNNAPDIQAIPDYCVMAGDSIRFKVTATDPDIGQHVTLSGTGGPLEVSSDPADFPQPFTGVGTVSSTFTWATNCDHIRKEFYEMVFKAEDDFGKQHLVDMESVLIRIIGPPAQNLTAVPFGNTMVLDWNPPRCGNATGYKIYRRIGCANFVPDTCKPGIDPSSGFVLIGSVDASTFTFTDDNGGLGLSHGKTYSYVVVAMYPNETNGLASSQVCMQLKKDVPIITHVDVRKTDPSNGEVYLQWSMPTELDTIKFPGPYTYRIYGNSGFYENNPALIGIENALTDTFSVHLGVNTVDDANTYRIDLYNGPSGSETYLGSTQAASSIFLTLDGSDNALQLTWQENVPWTNKKYVVHKWDGSQFVAIDTVTTQSYKQTGLTNGQDYCYKIEGIGTYGTVGIADPLNNFSQEVCAAPIDTVPPCSPKLTVHSNCDNAENLLNWSYPAKCDKEVIAYKIYYATGEDGPFSLLDTYPVNGPVDSEYVHANLPTMSGCYAVTALDSSMNESEMVPVCVDTSCTEYVLPNVFTPNGDTYNDQYRPFPYRFVDKVHMQVFNRWGTRIFETSDPDIKWNGKIQGSGNPCSEGVYYYVCEVYRKSLQGPQLVTVLTGYIQLIGAPKPSTK